MEPTPSVIQLAKGPRVLAGTQVAAACVFLCVLTMAVARSIAQCLRQQAVPLGRDKPTEMGKGYGPVKIDSFFFHLEPA